LRGLRDLAARARRADPRIERIVLFGSLAKDSYTPASDADLLILLTHSDERFIDRIPRFLRMFVDASVPVEVFPYTAAESQTVPLARRALKEGMEL
jgi:predicted nucleotidyltransferase